jgi:hypothetical protein
VVTPTAEPAVAIEAAAAEPTFVAVSFAMFAYAAADPTVAASLFAGSPHHYLPVQRLSQLLVCQQLQAQRLKEVLAQLAVQSLVKTFTTLHVLHVTQQAF